MAKKVKLPVAADAASDGGGRAAITVKGPLLATVRGHDAVMQTLQDALLRQRLPSTLLFVGPAGVGKLRTARGLAQCLLCERATTETPLACGECGPCVRVARGQSESVLLVSPQGAAIKIEQAQEAVRFLTLRQIGRARVVLIDDAHLLNPQAGNTLLKSLEEPPSGTYFILLTANPGALLATIRSRAQVIRFRSLSDVIVRELLSGSDGSATVKIEDWIVRAAGGSLERAMRLRENSDEWAGLRRAAVRVLGDLLARDAEAHAASFADLKELIKERVAALFVVNVWGRALRDCVVAQVAPTVGAERLLLPDQAELAHAAAGVPQEWLHQLVELCLQLEQDIHRNVDRTLAFEMFCLKVSDACSGREPLPVL